MPHETPEELSAGTSRRPWEGGSRTLTATVRNMAFQDWLALGFHMTMWVRVMLAPDSYNASMGRRATFALVVVTVAMLVMTRGEILRPGFARTLVYRLGICLPTFLSYFELHFVLPALQPHLLDLQLHAIDDAIFGVSPSVWLDQFVTPATTEWFAIFYYSYFYIAAAYLVSAVFVDKNALRIGELMAGATIVVFGTHLGYTLVPGMGPHATLAFEHPLVGGYWWKLVASTVATSGAQLDIFPSLHTGFPSLFLFHAIRQRRSTPFAIAWPVTAFFVMNIIIATLFLRWHWGIDILVGFTLAFVGHRAGVYIAGREIDRTRAGRQAVWEPFSPAA